MAPDDIDILLLSVEGGRIERAWRCRGGDEVRFHGEGIPSFGDQDQSTGEQGDVPPGVHDGAGDERQMDALD